MPGRIRCRGGCGRDLDPDLHPGGICDECEAAAYREDAEEWRLP